MYSLPPCYIQESSCYHELVYIKWGSRKQFRKNSVLCEGLYKSSIVAPVSPLCGRFEEWVE